MNFFHYYKARQGEMISLLKDLVYLESPSSDKQAVDRCSAFIIQEFKKIGAKITRIPQENIGDLYVAHYPPKIKSPEKDMLVLTHVDTVWPVGKLETMPFHVVKDTVYGPGVLDMKAGIVMIMFALKTLHGLNLSPQRRVAVFFDSYEEIGNEMIDETIRQQAKKAHAVLCLEPAMPGGVLKVRRKGRYVIRLSVKGQSAHAGSPADGINAIDELMYQLKYLYRLRSQSISINTGIISGGETINTVAQQAAATLDIRFWTKQQAEKIISHLKAIKPQIPGARVTYSLGKQTPSMEHTDANKKLFKQAQKIAHTLDIDLPIGKTGGGSDASVASSLNVPTLDGLGPEGGGNHAEDEHLLIPSLLERTTLLTEMLLQL